MNYCGLNKCDTTNGTGIRVSLFVSGCTLHCKGCFNEEAWDFNYGKEFTLDTLYELIQALQEDYIDGLSILGGDPLEEQNIKTVTDICKLVKLIFPDKTIWLYTGRRYEKVLDLELFNYVDVVVDGAFIKSKKITGKFYGSSNQRIIEIAKYEDNTD